MARLKDALELEKEKEEEKMKNEEKITETDKTEELISVKVENVEVPKEAENFDKEEQQEAEPKPELPAATQQPKLSKHEREKYYKLPSSPQIIVHPSNTAKNGKFDCQLISLSSLLDYRKDDNKETTFEVSLFAECFHEMLIRDFGFVIYKSLLAHECEKLAFKNVNNLKRKLPSPTRESGEQIDDSKRIKSTTNDDKPSTQAAPVVISNSDMKIKSTKAINQNLLLAFLFFDTNRTNYLLEKDLEDLLLTIGLSLNRSKLKLIYQVILSWFKMQFVLKNLMN